MTAYSQIIHWVTIKPSRHTIKTTNAHLGAKRTERMVDFQNIPSLKPQKKIKVSNNILFQ